MCADGADGPTTPPVPPRRMVPSDAPPSNFRKSSDPGGSVGLAAWLLAAGVGHIGHAWQRMRGRFR
jgi:hypothetical protein